MDVVEKVARAMWRASGGYGDVSPEPAVAMLYERKARAAIAAVLEAVGEPVVWYANWGEDGVRELYDLSPLTQALAAVENP